jgi:hypothetical protein
MHMQQDERKRQRQRPETVPLSKTSLMMVCFVICTDFTRPVITPVGLDGR